jgi:hypothetical protein
MTPDEPKAEPFLEDPKLVAQLPDVAPEPPRFYDDPDDLPRNYLTEPPNLKVIAFMKRNPDGTTRYNNITEAKAKALELTSARGEKIYRLFETARAFVAQVYRPLGVGEGFR